MNLAVTSVSLFSRLLRQKGFTLIELVVTLAIISILALVALPLSEAVVKRNKEQQLRVALQQIREAIDAYKGAVEDGKIAQSVVESGYPPDLKTLVDGAVNIKDPKRNKIYFIRKIPSDPFSIGDGNDAYTPEETWGLRSYKSEPDDPQEGEDVFDVYSKSTGVGINGVPYREW